MKQQFLAMIDKEIDSIKGTIGSEGTGSNMIYILEKLRSDVEKMDSGWISVNDRLPTRISSILVYAPGSIVGANRVFTVLFGDLEYLESIGITHWQELPKAPIK